MLRSAKDILASGDVGAAVDFAIEANRTVASTSSDLDVVKAHLRGLAEASKRNDPTLKSVKFEGHLGIAHVVMVSKPVFRARKGMRLADLKKVRPSETYESLFAEKVVVDVADDYETNFSNLSPGQRIVVEKFVESVPQTARVNLPE
jgi:hypothetical protein